MQLLLPNPLIRRLLRELRRAGNREIGGLLMGEHVREEVFRIVDISVQRSGGTHACFIRHPKDHQKALKKFFARTGNDYRRFNYLGEWHSHPGFAPVPSDTDVRTMQSLVVDATDGANFLVLLIAKQDHANRLQATATVFSANSRPLLVPLQNDAAGPVAEGGMLTQWLRRIFSF
jgi:integrative and conjugative element protein (TIGR02256 family)